jgi:hypothetical protein
MHKISRKIILIIILSCLYTSTYAQSISPKVDVNVSDSTNKERPFNISGGMDLYYKGGSRSALSYTAYTHAFNAFQIGTANLIFSKESGKVGFKADLFLGERAEQFNYNYHNSGIAIGAIKQLYITYKPFKIIKFTFGSFSTFFDRESVDANKNLNYSMSYIYTNGPFFHTGLKMDVAFSLKFSAMIGIFDAPDTKGFSGHKNYGGQLSYADGKFKSSLNFLIGDSLNSIAVRNTFVNFNCNYQVSPKFGLGLNIENKTSSPNAKFFSDASTNWIGIALYADYAISNKFTLALRGENFNDKSGLAFYGTTLNEFTASINFKHKSLTLIPELRYDTAGDNIFLFGNGTSQWTYLLAVVYKF